MRRYASETSVCCSSYRATGVRVATTVTRQGLDLLSEDTAHGMLYSRGGLLPCPVMALMNKLSSLLCVGGLGTDASCLGYNGCSGTFETGYSLGTPFLSFPLPHSGETCWVTQSLGRHPVNPYSSGNVLEADPPVPTRLCTTVAVVATLGKTGHPRAARLCLWSTVS